MKISQHYIRLILGLKIKQLRTEKGLSLSELAEQSGLSVSYLNEIESGKKYPKTEKIAALSAALGTSYDKLISLKLTKQLAPIGDLLESNILEKLPLEHYGIDLNKFIALMSSAPMQLSALVSTIIDLAKSSELSENNFSRTALRTFKEIHDNYFEEIEDAAEKFTRKYKLNVKPPIDQKALTKILVDRFNYQVDYTTLANNKVLNKLRGFSNNGQKRILYLNERLSESQKAFIIAKEIGYNYLNLTDRSYIYANIAVDNFDHLLNNFRSSYFANAVILNKKYFIGDLQKFFSFAHWKEDYLIKLIDKYKTSPEMLFQRISNLSAKYLGLNKYFFLRFNSSMDKDEYFLSKEVRLNLRTSPGGYQTQEHLCRRWISIENLRALKKKYAKDKTDTLAGIIHSRFESTEDEFIAISLAKVSSFLPGAIYSVTLGFLFDETLKDKIKFVKDKNIPFHIVNNTCETCGIADCKDRAAPPVTLEREEYLKKVKNALSKFGIDSLG